MNRTIAAVLASVVMGCGGEYPSGGNSLPTNGPSADSVAVDTAAPVDTADSVDNDTGSAPTFANVMTVFNLSCNFGSCHGTLPSNQNGDLGLGEDIAFDALVGVEPDNDQARDDGMLRVDPGHPDNSFLLFKLNMVWDDPEHEPFGDPMPQVKGAQLSADAIAVIEGWIAAGALNN